MKTPFGVYVVAAFSLISAGILYGAPTAASQPTPAVPSPTPYSVVGRDANSRVWERTVYELGPSGQVIAGKNRYVELATGLNYWSNGQWVESQEEIELYNGGAIARQGQHKVIFANNLATVGAIDLETPDGQRLRSHILGLSYFDTDSGQSVLIAEVKDSIGQLTAPNQVLYEDAFTDFKADVHYTYTKTSFEQDVVLRERPPLPEAYGLNSASTVLQVLTEFVAPPQPVIHENHIQMTTGTRRDQTMDFGMMKMVRGRAFDLGNNDREAPVAKSWLTLEGRQFLVEEVPVGAVAELLDELPLPPQASHKPSNGSVRHIVSNKRLLPGPPVARTGGGALKVTKASVPAPGLVLDYLTINSGQTNYVFQADTTYYISGPVNLSGTTTIEGGAVIKYAATNSASVTCGGTINCLSSAYRPAIFTAKDDNSVGETIAGSSGSPTNYYAATALRLNSGASVTLQNLRFSYAQTALALSGSGGNVFSHVQMVGCQNGINATNAGFSLRNALFWNVRTDFGGSSSTGAVEQLTVDTASLLNTNLTLSLTNCLLVAVTNVGTTFTSNSVSRTNNSTGVFLAAGAGAHYLATNSPYRNIGTTNLNPALLAALKKMTTYPPVVYSNTILSAATSFAPQAQRDTNNSPALGYHYDPIDYIADQVTITNAALTVTNGAVIASYNRSGIQLQTGSSIVSLSSPLVPNRFVRYQSVQEKVITFGSNTPASALSINPNHPGTNGPAGIFRFTQFICPVAGGSHLFDAGTTNFSSLLVQDCEFWGGQNCLSGSTNTTATLKNNLFFRSVITATATNLTSTLNLTNNLFFGGLVSILQPTNKVWSAFNNNFDSCTITNSTLTNGYNAYLNCSGRLQPANANDVVQAGSLSYQSGPLGSFYQPSSSLLIDKGNTNANLLGLYHFTTQTNQVKETNSVVDMGYHYVAVDANGNPVDSNGDGIPDYIQDANGNGLVDAGETNWGLAILTQPVSRVVPQGTNVTFTVTAAGVSPLSYQWFFNGTNVLGGAIAASLNLSNVQTNNAGNYTVVVTNITGSLTSSNAILTVTGPSINLSPGDLYCLVGAAPTVIDCLATVTNAPGCPSFSSRTLTVSLITNVQPEDALAINNQGAGTNQIGITNNFVTYWGTNIATFGGGGGSNALVISFLSTPTVTTPMVQALLTNITYRYYPSTNEFLGQRAVQFVLSDCDGNTNYPARKNIDLTCPWSLDVMLVMDCSGSMTNRIGTGGTNKLDAAKAAAISFVMQDMQFTNDQVGLVTFSTTATNRSGLTNNPNQVINIINGLKGGGNTDIGDGITNAQADFPTNVPAGTLPVMILLTDGLPNEPSGTNPTNYCISKASLAKQAGIRLITIGLGTNGDFNPNLLTTLASSSGDFIWATNTDALTPIYHSIGCSLCRPPTNQPPTVQIISPANNASFNSGAPITNTAVAYDIVDTVASVQFYYYPQGGATNLIPATVTQSGTNWSVVWTNAPVGSNAIYAVAADYAGLVTTSAPPVNITVQLLPPVIIQQPTNVTLCAGSAAGFCVTATGTAPLGYQWQFNGTNISGATGSCYTLTNVQPGQAGNYSVVVSNTCGSVTSTNAILTVNVAPAITGQPTNVTVCAGSGAGFCVTATGSSLNYQWQFNGTNISGATGSCYTPTNVLPNQAGIYAVVVSNTCGSVTSTNAILTVNVAPAITGQPANVTVCAGSGAGFCVTATGSPLNYQWQFNGTNISGATGSCYTLTNVQPGQAGSYSVVVSNSCGSVTSTNAILTVNVAPVITGQPTNVTVCAGSAAGFCVMATGSSLNYQWQFNGTNISGATGSCYTLTNVQPNQAGIYTVVVSNTCGSVTSTNAILTVNVPPVITGQPTNLTVCAGSGAGFCVTATGSSLNYQWQFNGTNISGATGSCYTLTNVQPSQAGIYAVVVSNSCGSVTSTNAILTVNVAPGITQQPVNVTTNVGGSATFTVMASGMPNPNYQWYFNSGVLLPNATNAVLTLTNVQLNQAGIYSVVVSNAAGSVNSIYAVLRVWTLSSIVGWGSDSSGEIDVPVELTNGVAIAGGANYSLALRSDGTVVGWGRNDYGQTNVPPDLTNVVAIASDIFHSLALKNDGTVVGWGRNDYGQANVPPNLTNAVAIAAGYYHSLTLKSDGTVVGWGRNDSGQADVPPNLTNVVAIAASGYHSLALKSDGTVVGWGRNDYGQGNVPPNLTNVVAIAGGAYHSLALKSDGTVVAWGDDGFGETNVPPRLTNVVAIAAGVYHSLALKSDGTVVAWGYDVFGETNVPPRLTNVVAIAAGSHHNLALDHFPPWITTQPANQTSFTGITVIFSVTATGTWPLSYQWSLNGTNIMGATNMTLTLTNIQLSQAGNYMVLVTNAYGSALSTNAILNVIQPTPCIDPPNGLVAWWRAETNALDSIGTNNGTLQEGAGFTDGMVGQAFSVDGVSSYVSIPNSPSLDAFTSTITIELWLKSDQFYSDWAGIVTKGNSSWQLQATPGANTVDFNISVSAGSLSGSRNVNDGQWHHVAAVYDGTNMFLYVDGTLDVSQPATGFIPQNNDPLCIGANAKAYVNSCNCNELGYFFNGLIDEVSIYNRALSSNEIAAIYCTRGNGKCVPPPAVPPVITQQPVNVTTNVGGNATFRVTATGTLPLSYQWWFNGTNALGGATNISLTLANVQTTNAGNYSVVVMNVAGSAISSNAVLSVYSPLSVQFVTPTNGQLFVTSPLNILLTAATSDSSGTVTNVQFFNGTSLLGNVTVASSNTWTLLWTNVVAGNYSLTAIASDNAGNMATNGISIIVNAMPVVSIITPTNFQPCLQSSNITLSASASDSDGFIAQVQFYYFTNLWGTVTSTGANGYYNFTTNNLPPGFYPITATAMDNRGAVGWSDIKIFRVISTNTPPTVAITFPTNGATFAPGCDITITVTATANTNAAITNVEFFVNGESIGSDSASPYNLTRCCWGSGTYQLAAKATDNLGMSMFSTNVQIIVLGEPPTGDGFWDPYFGNTNINNHFDHVTAMTVHGTDLYIGGYGYMSTNNGPALNSLVKWDGTNWSGMGCSQLEGTGVEPNLLGMVPYAIAVDGTNIYVGGQYMGDSGTILAKCIGTNWLDLGGTNIPSQYYSPSPDGPPVTINAIAIVGSDVYVGGDFVGDADTNIQYIARLNPSDLSPEPIAGLNGPVFALATIGNKLFAGGTFTNAGGNSSANYIAEWDGNVWTNLGTGVGGLNSFGKPGAVYALAACGSNLYVGGDFTTVGGHTNANGIARWDGKQWTTLHDGLIGGGSSYNGNDHFRSYSPYKNIPSMRVLSISTRGNTLFVGGAFTRASQGTGQTLVNYIAKAEWSEQSQTWTWTDLDEGVTGENYLINNNYIVTSTAIMEGSTPGSYDLFVGGSFDRVGSAQISDYGMARWSVGRPYPAGPPSIIITNPVSMTIFTNPSCSYRTIETNEDGRISTNLVASTNIIINIVTTALSYTNIRSVNISTNGQLLFPGTTYDNVPNPSSSLTITNFWINPPCGVFLLTAVAEDQLGVDSKPSQPVLVDIKNPTNSITAVDDQYTIPEGSPAVTFYVLTNDIPANGLKISQITRIHANLGNAAVSFGGSCIRYTPFPNVYGIDTIYYTVTNSDRALDTAAVTVNILPLPQVNIKLPWDGQQFTNLTSSLVVTGWVASVNTDTNASVTNVTLYVIDANSIQSADQTPTNGTFSFNWLNRTPGFYTFVAVATDGNGYTNTSAPVTVSLHDSNAPSHIVTAVISNLDSTVSSQSTLAAEIYPIISDGYFELQGRAADSIPTNPVAYQVLLFQPDPYAGMATGDPAIEYLGDIPFANLTPGPLNGQGYHNGGDTNGDLGRLDLTGIPNGVYVIMLKVRGGDDETNALVQVQINSQLKIGQFSFTEQDLVLPVNGIPITVTRTYNSQNLHSGDFGTGWTYAMNSMDVQLDDQRKDVQIGGNSFPFSDQDGFVMPTDTSSLLPHTVSIRAGGNWDVTLTLPDGRRTTFTFTVNGVWPNFYAGWQAPPGVSAKLEMIGNNQLVCGVLGFNVPVWADSDLTFGHAPMEYHDVAGWILTTQPDGTTYYITRGTKNSVVFDSTGYGDYISAQVYDAKPKLTKIVQHSGNVIQIGDNGITNYSGTNLTRSITFDRDYAGRITAVYDPISQLSTLNSQPAVKYIYDRDNDNLLQVLKLVDRNAGTYTTNQYHYDNPYFPHFITSIENGNGVPVARNYYDDSGKLIAVQDANGNLTQFIHDTANNMEVIVDQLGYGSTNYYDSRGNVTTTVNALGQTNRFAFDSNNYLLQSVDPLGHTNSYGYDANGCRIASTNALGQATHFKFDNYGQLLSKTDALMNATSFGYDSGGHRTSVTDALGNPTTFGHDVYGRPNAVTDALSRLRATAGSDSSGNLQFVSQVGGLQMNFGHDLNGNTTNTSFVWVNPNDPNQTQTLSTITELDAANRVTRVTDPDGQSRMTIYDPAGRVAQSIDRMGNTNSYVYDAMGNTIQTTYADGSVTRNVYDARSQVLYSDDRHLPGLAANGTHNVYDPLGRVIRTERLANVQIDVASSGTTGQSAFNSAGAVLSASSTAYDAAGRVLAATNALGYVTRYEYDAVGRQTAVVDALTNRTDSVYDAAGQLQFTTNALKQVTEYQYDAKGRRIKTIFPDNSYTTNSYNEIGQLMFVKDQAGLETDYQYDSLGRMTNISKPPVFNPEGGTNANPQWEYQYDSYGNILDIRDPKGRETKFTYDAFGQLISRTLPLLQTNFNAYNALGQLAMAVDFLGQSNRFVYDSLGRVATNFLYAAGATAPSRTNIFIYDANGRLYQTLRPEGITTFQYNLDGAVTNITSPEGAISYEYDPTMGSLARVYTLNSDIRYSYDELSRLKTVSVVKRDGATLAVPEVTTNTYTRLGSLQDMFYPNGVHAAYQYDMMNRLTNLTCTSSASVLLSQYQYVPNANSWRLAATEVLRQVNGTYVTNQLAWGYDNLGRLTNEASSSTLAALNYTNKYVYDLAGNRLWKTNVVGAVTTITSYSYNANDQLLVESTGSIIFTNRYDANGSLTNRSSASEVNVYSYNLEGRLATAAINQQQTNKYYYNQSGIRTRMDIFGSVSSTNIFLNDPQNLTGFSQVLEELPRVGAAPTATYTLGSQIISQEKSGTTLHLMADGHGSTRLLTDSSGAVQNAFTYDGYGSLIASNAAPQTAYLYSGERFDSDLRQYYLRARYYNPAVGRFGAMDQVDGTPNDPLSLHKYAYTQNNPVNMRDPSGNESLMSLTISMSIGVSMQLLYNSPTLYHGYIAAKQVTELGASRESILDAASRNASPDVTTATIIVHGVAGHPNGWSQDLATTPFQQNLSNPVGKTPKKGVENDPLNHDFYEFDWGGFSIVNAPPFLIPIKSVHEMALVHLQMAEFLVWMNGYGNIDIISHSWGTTLSYDLMNSTDIEVHDWVTMGSPLKQTTEKPVENTGNWINCYDLNDPVVHLEMYPPFPNICGLPLPSSLIGAGLTAKQGIIQLPYDFGFGLFSHPFVHSDYWNSQEVLSDLRKWLQ